MARDLRDQFARPGRIVYRQLLRGAVAGVGSGAVNVIIVWWQNRR
ncbi:hypothetical protein [Streptomyces chartreusis]